MQPPSLVSIERPPKPKLAHTGNLFLLPHGVRHTQPSLKGLTNDRDADLSRKRFRHRGGRGEVWQELHLPNERRMQVGWGVGLQASETEPGRGRSIVHRRANTGSAAEVANRCVSEAGAQNSLPLWRQAALFCCFGVLHGSPAGCRPLLLTARCSMVVTRMISC